MTEEFDIRNVLGKKPEEVKLKPLMPQGMYKWAILSNFFDKSSQKKTDYVGFKMRVLEAGANVDPTALEMWKQEMKECGLEWDKEEREHDCYLTANPTTHVMFKEFLETLGVNMNNRTFFEVLPYTTGCQVWGEIKHEANTQRPGRFQERFGTFSKVE